MKNKHKILKISCVVGLIASCYLIIDELSTNSAFRSSTLVSYISLFGFFIFLLILNHKKELKHKDENISK
jgi:hypothetical protein